MATKRKTGETNQATNLSEPVKKKQKPLQPGDVNSKISEREQKISNSETDRTEFYSKILPELKSLIEGERDYIANCSNFCAKLYQDFHEKFGQKSTNAKTKTQK